MPPREPSPFPIADVAERYLRRRRQLLVRLERVERALRRWDVWETNALLPEELRAWASAQGHGELLPQEQVLEHERLAPPERGPQRAEEEQHPVRHGTVMARGADRHPDGVLAPYSPRLPVWLPVVRGGSR